MKCKICITPGGVPPGANNMGPFHIIFVFISSSIINHHATLINHQSSIISYQSSIIHDQWSIISHQSSIINHQSSMINDQSIVSTHQSSFFLATLWSLFSWHVCASFLLTCMRFFLDMHFFLGTRWSLFSRHSVINFFLTCNVGATGWEPSDIIEDPREGLESVGSTR